MECTTAKSDDVRGTRGGSRGQAKSTGEEKGAGRMLDHAVDKCSGRDEVGGPPEGIEKIKSSDADGSLSGAGKDLSRIARYRAYG